MEDAYYKKSLKCPVCLFEFSSNRVKSKALKVKSKDEDFCVHYEKYNPMYYEIYICPNCGYGASNNSFSDLNEREKKLLIEAFAGRVIGRDFTGIRNHNDAIDSFKIAFYTASVKKSSSSILAGLALKTAWLYRYIDDNTNEKKLLEIALKYYEEAYENEGSNENSMDEISVVYLLGEISRRLNKYEIAIKWFNVAINHPKKDKNLRIEKLTREQWRKVREEIKHSKTE